MISFNLTLAIAVFYIICLTGAYDYGILIDVLHGGALGSILGIGAARVSNLDKHSQNVIMILITAGAAVGAYVSIARS